MKKNKSKMFKFCSLLLMAVVTLITAFSFKGISVNCAEVSDNVDIWVTNTSKMNFVTGGWDSSFGDMGVGETQLLPYSWNCGGICYGAEEYSQLYTFSLNVAYVKCVTSTVWIFAPNLTVANSITSSNYRTYSTSYGYIYIVKGSNYLHLTYRRNSTSRTLYFEDVESGNLYNSEMFIVSSVNSRTEPIGQKFLGAISSRVISEIPIDAFYSEGDISYFQKQGTDIVLNNPNYFGLYTQSQFTSKSVESYLKGKDDQEEEDFDYYSPIITEKDNKIELLQGQLDEFNDSQTSAWSFYQLLKNIFNYPKDLILGVFGADITIFGINVGSLLISIAMVSIVIGIVAIIKKVI